MELKIYESGTWHEIESFAWRRIEKTKFANYPQIVWEFITKDGNKFSVWSKLIISPMSKIGTFLTALRGSEPQGTIQLENLKLEKNSVEALIDTRPDPKGIKRTMIIRFRAITKPLEKDKEVKSEKQAVREPTLRIENPKIHNFM